MTSRCTIRRRTGEKTTDASGWEVSVWATPHTDLPLRIGGADAGASGFQTQRAGEVDVQVANRTASFPASTSDLRDGDLIEVTSGETVGAVLRIVEASWQDQATARRVPVVEAQRPGEWT
jgi:hypothetical protein